MHIGKKRFSYSARIIFAFLVIVVSFAGCSGGGGGSDSGGSGNAAGLPAGSTSYNPGNGSSTPLPSNYPAPNQPGIPNPIQSPNPISSTSPAPTATVSPSPLPTGTPNTSQDEATLAGAEKLADEIPHVTYYGTPGTAIRDRDTLSRVMINSVPWIKQANPPGTWSYTRNCGQTCYLMVECYLNGTIPSAEGIKSIDDWLDTSYGDPVRDYNGSYTTTAKLVDLAREYGNFKNAERHSGWSLDQLRDELDQGYPVIVGVYTRMNTSSGVPHFMVLVGIEGDDVYVNDPGRDADYNGHNKVYSLDAFLGAWGEMGYSAVTIHRNDNIPVNTAPAQYSVGQGGLEPQKFIDAFNRVLCWGSSASVYLGTPVNEVHRWGNGWVQDFSGGRYGPGIIMLSDGGRDAYSIWGGDWDLYKMSPMPGTNPSSNGIDCLGYPISDQCSPSNWERYSLNWYGGGSANMPGQSSGSIIYFQKGYITWIEKGPWWTKTDPLSTIGQNAPNPQVFRDAYNRGLDWGSPASLYLGVPINPAHRWGNGWVQDFKGGRYGGGIIMLEDGNDKAYTVWGSYYTLYMQNPMQGTNPPTNGIEWLGYPTSDARKPSDWERYNQNWYGGGQIHMPTSGDSSIIYFRKGYMTFVALGAWWTKTK